MRTHSIRLILLVFLASFAANCSQKTDDARPVATPSVTLSRTEASVGSPIEMTYRFAVAADAPPMTEDYTVFVHVIDTGRERLWGDDHLPPTPTRQWKPGSTIEYTRTMFVPKFPYVGEAQIEVGLYSPKTGARVPLAGETLGGRSIKVAAFNMRLATDANFVVFKNGWHDAEVTDDAGVEWQWSKKEGTLSFRNPRRDAQFLIQLDQPVQAFSDPQHVEIKVGPAVVDMFPLPYGSPQLRRISLSQQQMGSGDTVAMSVVVDRTFVPAALPALKSSDSRELGARVFRVFVEPKQ